MSQLHHRRALLIQSRGAGGAQQEGEGRAEPSRTHRIYELKIRQRNTIRMAPRIEGALTWAASGRRQQYVAAVRLAGCILCPLLADEPHSAVRFTNAQLFHMLITAAWAATCTQAVPAVRPAAVALADPAPLPWAAAAQLRPAVQQVGAGLLAAWAWELPVHLAVQAAQPPASSAAARPAALPPLALLVPPLLMPLLLLLLLLPLLLVCLHHQAIQAAAAAERLC